MNTNQQKAVQVASTSTMASVDNPTLMINMYRSYVMMLMDNCKEDVNKIKAMQEISENFEVILSSPMYPNFLTYSVQSFLKILQEGEPHFIAEFNPQQLRKLMLEILHRLPTNDYLKPYVKPILTLTLKLLEIDNEENVLVCLKIIIEFHKQYRPEFNDQIERFLQFVKQIYRDLPSHMNKIFEPRQPINVADLSELNIEELLNETFSITTIQTDIRNEDKTFVSYNLIPKAVLSLKVIQELPIIVVLMYQLYKEKVHQDVSDFIPLIMNTIVLQPSPAQFKAKEFNKEIFVDFMGAQIKTLSFLAYIIKNYQPFISNHSNMLVQGMLGLLTLCPMEVAHLRRELLIASRHILATDLRNKFVPHMERLFDEEVLLGRGWTTHESLRPLAYSTLADLVHHVRQHLTLADIARAVHLFSKNVHDDSLATTIQTMSCKLLLNLVECIKKRVEVDTSSEGRGLLMRMLEVFVLKFKTIAKIQLPKMMEKCKQQSQETATITKSEPCENPAGSSSSAAPSVGASGTINTSSTVKEEKPRFGIATPVNYNVSEYRSLVKTLVCSVKTITYASCKPSPGAVAAAAAAAAAGGSAQPGGAGGGMSGMKPFQPHETLVFIRLVKWALKALDIYTLNPGPLPAQQSARQALLSARTKEEKEVLEHFSTVFSMMHPQTFHEIFSTTIDYVVERVFKNVALQVVPSTLLANPTTSPIFATVLVEYLLEHMEEMGSNPERSLLYLKFFKLVFGSVSLFPQENEKMLRPHLHQIVNRSMELAMTAKDPHNYFLLLRALFRSIGGGSHDLLYQEFLPLLPNLLEGLNRLQSGLHKQGMKDLFVELCLTVPVRLSSLLPYLPMLMDPLVSALNGSHILISQGLRTLELCVDNLQHDFLYEHIQPVRADLMQALWRTLRNNDQVAQVAFKVLGKFGGGNRKMMIEPQRLDYVSGEYEAPAIYAKFPEQEEPIAFPVDKVIETAFNALKQSGTEAFYRKQAWEVIGCYLTASLNLEDDAHTLMHLFMQPAFQDSEAIPAAKGSAYLSVNKRARETHQTALIGMFVAAATKELRNTVLSTLVNVVRHYTMVAVAQQAGPFAFQPKANEQVALDPLVLVDALAIIMGHEENELIKPGHVALVIILNTATSLLGSRELACKLPLVEYIAEKMCALCYERAYYAKLGGCHAIKFLFENGATKWIYEHMFTFLKALLFVMMDLTGEVSFGALDMAKNNLEKMLCVLVAPPPENAREVQWKALCKVTHELVRQVTSPHQMVREQSMQSLRLLAEKQNKTVTAVMEPFREVLADMVPPKKHLLRHQPAIAQMGLMDGNMFCTTLKPRLFTIDMSMKEHNLFIVDLISLCNTEDSKLMNSSCYKNITNFTPLRKSALRVLAACHYLEADVRDNIFHVLYKMLEKPNAELQQTAFECMKSFIAGFQIEMELVHQTMRPLLMTFGDVKSVTLNNVKMLSYLTQLFPHVFNEKLCDQLIEILKKLLESLVNQYKTGNIEVSKKSEDELKIVTIINFFHQMLTASSKFIKPLCQLTLQTEQAVLIEAGSPFRESLMRFLLRYPVETLQLLMDEQHIRDPQYSRYLEYLLKHKEGKPFRDYLQNHMVGRLTALALGTTVQQQQQQQQQQQSGASGGVLSEAERNEMQYQSIRIAYLLVRHDEHWLNNEYGLVKAFQQIWCNDHYQRRHKAIDTLDYTHWREPKMLVKILLHYFCHHTDNIELLFQLLRALCDRFIPEFQFLKDFLEQTVAQNYTIEWKRKAFFLFASQFNGNTMSQELKAKVLQLILIPCFAVSFERGEMNKLLGEDKDPDNIVAVFSNRLIDPDNPFKFADCVRISLLQFSCLLVDQASAYVHDRNAKSKTKGFILRRLMTFAWPCLLGKNCVDAATRYHGHLLLSHIIDNFPAINEKIVLQVFHSLLKAHGLEARNVVRQALEILTPLIPRTMLAHWTKKLIVDEGHSMQQLFHILQLVVKHYKVYYPVRHSLVQYMVNSIQRLGFNQTATFEHRKLAVELSEVIIKWELYGIREDIEGELTENGKRSAAAAADDGEAPRKRLAFGEGSTAVPLSGGDAANANSAKPMDHNHTNAVLNYLFRLACQVIDPAQQSAAGNPAAGAGGTSPGEILSKRCVALIKTALKPDVWSQPIDLKLIFFDKILQSVDQANPNVGSVCTALELLTFLLTVLKKEQILLIFKPLQKGIGCCITSTNTKIIKLVQTLLTKLMEIFPTEHSSNIGSSMSCRYEELEILYSTVGKVIFDGLSNFEKNSQASTPSLYGTIMVLKAACINNNSYIDLLITPFMRVLHKIAKEHLQPTIPESSVITTETLILSLGLVKTRVVVMGVEMRKTFIGGILVGLIEKTSEVKVMEAIVEMLEEWMKNRNVITLSQAPSLREKSILLVKLMQYVEKRFPDNPKLNAQFLDLINYIYTDEQLRQTELSAKLEPAFLYGLRCNQPHIRAKFFRIFDESMRRRLHDRLLYITATQNWDAIGPHYWIKQCIELLLVTADRDMRIRMAHESSVLPNISGVVARCPDVPKREEFLRAVQEKRQSSPYLLTRVKSEEVLDMDLNAAADGAARSGSTGSSNGTEPGGGATGTNGGASGAVGGSDKVAPPVNRADTISKMVMKHQEFIEMCNHTSYSFLLAAAQLCHNDTALAEQVWLSMFPKFWNVLDEQQRNEIQSFIISGAHIVQKDCHPSAINTFVEALYRCQPPIQMHPPLMKHMAKYHNLWHRMALSLEQMAADPNYGSPSVVTNGSGGGGGGGGGRASASCYEFEASPTHHDLATNPKHEVMDSLGELYSLLCEEDMWAGLWQRHAHYKETNIAIAYEQHGFFEQAQSAYENAMAKHKQECNVAPPPMHTQREVLLWSNRWIRCAKELKQWDLLLDYVENCLYDPYLMLEGAWRSSNWKLAKEALSKVEHVCPKEVQWKVTLYGGFVLVCNPEEKPLKFAERYVETASTMCLQEWRRLPSIVSHIHLPYLQAAQQIMELQEAYQLRKGLQQGHQNSLHDMKAIVKTWRNRLPVIADDLSHWNDILTWRQHHYEFIVKYYEQSNQSAGGQKTAGHSNNSILGIHASAQSIIHFGKIARKHKLTQVALESLNRIHSILSLPLVDCFQKIRQQIKCCVQQISTNGSGLANKDYQEVLDVVNAAKADKLTSEMNAECYALRGMLYHFSGKSDEANMAFSAALQLHDASIKAWALYGDYLEAVFTRDPARPISLGVNAITCFLHACRHQNESKARKYLGKVLWLLSYDDDNNALMKALDKYAVGVPPLLWLPWIPQLLNWLELYEGNEILNLLFPVGKMFPQALYFPIRALYLTIRAAEARKSKTSQVQQQQQQQQQQQEEGEGQHQDAANTVKASPPMVRCSTIMKMQRDIHTTVLSSLEGIADQMNGFRESWYEEVVRQLRQVLAKCYAIAFENRDNVGEAQVSTHLLNFIRMLVSTFGIGVENIAAAAAVAGGGGGSGGSTGGGAQGTAGSTASETLARRAEATYQDPVFQEMKQEFTKDFDFGQGGGKLRILMFKLKKWIRILEKRAKIFNQSFLMEEKCRFLSNFTLKTAEVELPGESLLPKHTHYYVKITRFMPRVDIVQKHNTAARRLYIRGHNGKIYPYLVVNDSGLADARREERVLQLLRMMNHYLGKQKETSRRFLHYTVPRVVAVAQQIRLVEDNVASISLLDIFKKGCSKLGIEHDAPINHYYDRLANVQSRGIKASHQVFRDIFKSVQTTMVQRTMLKQWALTTFPSATDYWQFRKMFTLQLSLACFAEYILHLTRLNPDMMYLHQDSGLMNVSYFKFDVDDSSGELDTTRPVPFRLTPNIVEFVSSIGVGGPLTGSMNASARCFVYPNFKIASILKPILKDEMILSRLKRSEDAELSSGDEKKLSENEILIGMVNKAVTSIMNRLSSLAHFDGVDSNVTQLVAGATSQDNLCRMDPAWHPWL